MDEADEKNTFSTQRDMTHFLSFLRSWSKGALKPAAAGYKPCSNSKILFVSSNFFLVPVTLKRILLFKTIK